MSSATQQRSLVRAHIVVICARNGYLKHYYNLNIKTEQ